MPRIDTEKAGRSQQPKKKAAPKPKLKKQVRVNVRPPDRQADPKPKRPATPDQQDRSRAAEKVRLAPKAGDAPQTRKADTAKAEEFARSQYKTKAEKRVYRSLPPRTTLPPRLGAKALQRQKTAERAEAIATGPALKVLEQTTRPLHAQANAYNAALKGESITKAALRGLQNKDKTTFSDVLKTAGVKNKAVAGTAGFALDVAADPLTYVTGGTGSVALKTATAAARKAERQAIKTAAAKTAAQHAEQQAVKQGAAPKVAAKAGKEAARKHARRAGQKAGQAAAVNKPTNNGLSIKFAGREVPGITRATSAAKRAPRAVARKTRADQTRVGAKVDRAQQRVRDTSRNFASDFNPAIAPAGVDRELYQSARRSARTARAGATRGTYRAGQRAIAFRDAIGAKNYTKVIDAIETGTVSSLPKNLRGPARELQRDFARMLKTERRAGLKVGDIANKGPKPIKVPSREEFIANAPKASRHSPEPTVENLGRGLSDKAKPGVRVEPVRVEMTGRGGEVLELGDKLDGLKAVVARDENGRKIGVLHVLLDEKGKAQMLQVAVDPKHRGKGIASELYAAADKAGLQVEKASGKGGYTQAGAALAHKRLAARAEAVEAERAAGTPRGYVKHLRLKPEAKRGGVPAVGSKKVAPSFGKKRMGGTIAEKNAAEPGAYSENVADIYLNRGAESAVSVAKAKLNQAMTKAGRKPDRDVPIKQQLDENESLYKVDGANLVKIEPKSTEAAALPKGVRYVILNEKLISRTRGTVDAAAERSTAGVFFDKAQGVWKLAATQVNPGYHVRNLAGEMNNAYLAENPVTLGRNAAQAARALRQLGREEDALRVLGKKPKDNGYGDFTRTAEDVGAVRAGQLGREVQDMLGGASKNAKPAKARKGRLRKPARALKNVEDVFRLATYKGGIDRGLSPEMAMERASKNHFDYADLTPLERKVMRRVAPFWTFSARNIPLQARTLLTKPGKFANYQKVREELQNAFGLPDDWETNELSESEQRAAPLPVKIGGKTYNISLGPSGLPLTDLNEFPSTGDPVKQADEWLDRAMSMLTPAAKTPVEMWANMSFFFRDQIEKDDAPLVPAPSWVALIPEKYRKDLGITKNLRDSRSGKSKWGAPAKIVYALNVLPGPASFGNRLATESDRPGQSKTAKTIQYLGPRVRQNDATTVKIGKLYEDRGKVAKRIKTLGQQNLPGSTTKISAKTPTPEYSRLLLKQRLLTQQIEVMKGKRGDAGAGPKPKKLKKPAGFDFGAGGEDFDFSGGGSSDFDFGG